jgi:hypothetical protein
MNSSKALHADSSPSRTRCEQWASRLDPRPISIIVTNTCGINSAVECQLPKLKVAGSNPVSRSKKIQVVSSQEVSAKPQLAGGKLRLGVGASASVPPPRLEKRLETGLGGVEGGVPFAPLLVGKPEARISFSSPPRWDQTWSHLWSHLRGHPDEDPAAPGGARPRSPPATRPGRRSSNAVASPRSRGRSAPAAPPRPRWPGVPGR